MKRIRRAICRLIGHRIPNHAKLTELPPDWWRCPRCGNGWLS